MGRLRDMTGLFLLGIGLVGRLLPVIPGVPFLLGAVALLGPSHPWIQPWAKRILELRSLTRKHGAQGTSKTHFDVGNSSANR